jgi:hypothetical protein
MKKADSRQQQYYQGRQRRCFGVGVFLFVGEELIHPAAPFIGTIELWRMCLRWLHLLALSMFE